MARYLIAMTIAATALLTLSACDTGPKSPAEKVVDAGDDKAEVLEERADALRAEAKSLDRQADTVRAEAKAEANALVDQAVEDASAAPETSPDTRQ